MERADSPREVKTPQGPAASASIRQPAAESADELTMTQGPMAEPRQAKNLPHGHPAEAAVAAAEVAAAWGPTGLRATS